ncbi:MAG: response regulator [Flavobacteriales bacterium]|nr:response regulator [Flavobacteriales bacterium]
MQVVNDTARPDMDGSAGAGGYDLEVLDAVAAHVAIIEPCGRIRWVNQAWRSFALANGGRDDASCTVGANYYSVCETGGEALQHELDNLRRGIEEVMSGVLNTFSHEYPCHSLTEERWFRLTAYKLPPQLGHGALLSHANITQETRSRQALTQADDRFRRLFHALDEGVCVLELIRDQRDTVVDYRFLEFNERFQELFADQVIEGRTVVDVFPEVDHKWFTTFEAVATTGRTSIVTAFSPRLNRWYETRALKPWHDLRDRIAIIIRDVHQAEMARLDSAVLNRLSDLVRTTEEPERLLQEALATLGAHLQVERVFLAEIDQNAGTWQVHVDHADGVPSLSASHPLADVPQGLLATATSGAVLAVEDTRTDPGTAAAYEQVFGPLGVRRFVAVPVFRSTRWAACLVAASATPGAWDPGRTELIKRFTEVLWPSLEKKRSLIQLRQSEERFKALANAMTQFAWLADPTGHIYWYNQRWYDYTGTDLEQMAGWGWKAVHHPDHVDRVVDRIQRSWDSGEPWEDIFPLRGSDGQYRWFLSRAEAYRDAQGQTLFWVGTNTDITEQRDNEQRLAASDRRKSEFLATLSHELRNPLAPIRNAVQLLRGSTGDTEAWADARAVLERQTALLSHLVDDLLDLGRIDTGKLVLRREHVQLARIIAQAVETSSGLVRSHGHELVVADVDPTIHLDADPTRLTQVFSNLLNNAARYTPNGGRIEVLVTGDARSVAVTVKDNGRGIPAERKERIFDMFTQLHSDLEAGRNGLGIGLAVVRNLVSLHDGSVEVYSDGVDQGSAFTVRLPIVAHKNAEAARAKTDAGAIPPRRIAIVDDNEDAAQILALLLRNNGHTVEVAHDGRAGVELVKRSRPEVVLMDIGMPVMNGYEACRTIRAEHPDKDLVIVALTGWGQEEDVQRAMDAGFDKHLIKPIGRAVVNELLRVLPGPKA